MAKKTNDMIKNYTDVILKDGRSGTIIEVFDDAYYVEIDPPTEDADVWDCILTVTDEDIISINDN